MYMYIKNDVLCMLVDVHVCVCQLLTIVHCQFMILNATFYSLKKQQPVFIIYNQIHSCLNIAI